MYDCQVNTQLDAFCGYNPPLSVPSDRNSAGYPLCKVVKSCSNETKYFSNKVIADDARNPWSPESQTGRCSDACTPCC